MKRRPTLIAPLLSILLLLIGCARDQESSLTPSAVDRPNILFILADDLGKDALSGYSEGRIKPATPHLDSIRKAGLLFSNLWVYPTCSPTRASILTGKYGFRTGVNAVGDVLSNSETSLHHYISSETNSTYATALIGKWHLARANNSTYNPEIVGIDYYAGLLAGASDYTQWALTEKGKTTIENSYITEKFTSLAIDWIHAQKKPWFLWLAYTAPHTPFHVPPTGMHSQKGLTEYRPGIDPLPYYLATIEAMDYQIGRLLSSIPASEKENTVIIFLGDNGTPGQVAQFPYSDKKAKNTLFQGGINTPMMVSGAGVSRKGQDNNLLTGTDLYATIAELSGVAVRDIHDSKSFTSLLSKSSTIRDYQYSEINDGSTQAWAISNGTYKLVVQASGQEQMYHLTHDPYENTNLLAASLTSDAISARSRLVAELARIRK